MTVSRESNGNAGETLSSFRARHRTPGDWQRQVPLFQPDCVGPDSPARDWTTPCGEPGLPSGRLLDACTETGPAEQPEAAVRGRSRNQPRSRERRRRTSPHARRTEMLGIRRPSRHRNPASYPVFDDAIARLDTGCRARGRDAHDAHPSRRAAHRTGPALRHPPPLPVPCALHPRSRRVRAPRRRAPAPRRQAQAGRFDAGASASCRGVGHTRLTVHSTLPTMYASSARQV